ncbi:hypothetical protein CXB49_11880 [Chromobacterium sp. ATCC 53434]|uniref:DotA/TraY family protein n=1 Tax=Chromobacterium sp. (strain ATCC 53434 / SC 14030) TaxID=2059672 RepID=UPI000C7585F8|nr:DotA/TraY family protein [Chromobacterium sp. ATCC 53434]AUH51467.1 hypothetical protein CXB49_11880 [Chromobacterium sp. ATCC 53434]
MSVLSEGAKGIGFVFLERVLGSDALSYYGIHATGVNSAPMTTGMALAADVALWFTPLITFYIMAMGLIYSSQEGVVLGKRWSAVIVPLRGVGGLMFSAPVVPGGLSAIQVMVVGLALLGNYIGNEAANVLASRVFLPGNGYVHSRPVSLFNNTAMAATAFAAITASVVCVDSAKNLGLAGSTPGASGGGKRDASAGGASNAAGASSATTLWGVISGSTQAITQSVSDICSGAGTPASSGQGAAAGGTPANYDSSKVDCAQAPLSSQCGAIQRAAVWLRKAVENLLRQSGGVLDENSLALLAGAYLTQMNSAIDMDMSGVIKENVKAVQKLGWPGLGNFYQKYSSFSGEIDNYIYYSGEPKFTFKDIGDETRAGMALNDQARMAFKNAFKTVNFSVQGILGGFFGNLASAANASAVSALTELQIQVENRVLRNLLFGFGNSAYDVGAFDAVQRLGGLLNMFGTTTLDMLVCDSRDTVAGPAGAPAKCEAAKSSGDNAMISNAVKSISGAGMADVATMMAKSAIMASMVLTMLLPSLPTIYFVLMTLEWVIWLVVAVLASPLWMIFHMLPDGDSLVHSRAETGWGLLAYVTLFPLLVVLGFCASMTLFNVAVPFAFEMMMSVTGSTAIGASLDFLVKPMLMAAVVIGVTFMTMGLMISLPHRIANWLNINPQSDSLQDGKNQLGVVNTPRLTDMSGGASTVGNAVWGHKRMGGK